MGTLRVERPLRREGAINLRNVSHVRSGRHGNKGFIFKNFAFARKEKEMAGIKSMTVEVFDGATVLAKMKTFAPKREVKAVFDVAKAQGFVPSNKPADVQGFKRTYKPEGSISEGGLTVTKLDFTYTVQELRKAGSNDKAAIVVTTLAAPGVFGGTDIDVRLLVAPNGDVEKAAEMRFDKVSGTVVQTNSWWTRFKKCITGKCGSTCKASLGTCAFAGWAAYLQCVAIACGGCSAKCVACASCNGRFWCRWAVGTCKN